MTSAALMLQGTGSDVGKSLLAAGLCRAARRRGHRVLPFKPQNMSNNAAVTVDGGEIGRAQALQAQACGVEPHTDMNPVLLKPQTDMGSQVVVHGRMHGNAKAREYQSLKPTLLPKVLDSFQRLRQQADLVMVEGAGSPAEINLRQGDIANMGFARAADVPVVLVGDIDRGGVIAQLVGTWQLLDDLDRRQIGGYLVNKFRGDASLFDDGLALISERTGMQSFGVLPYFADAGKLPAEDAVQVLGAGSDPGRAIRIAVPVFSRIANFDDLDPLAAEPDVSVIMVEPGQAIPGDADLVILAGSKATLADLAFVRRQGWDVDLRAHHRRGGAILGICGGYQMLGRRLSDPDGIEGAPAEVDGLGYLDVDTVLTGDKTLTRVSGQWRDTGDAVTGYRMHVGRTAGADCDRPLVHLSDGPEGATSDDGLCHGTYVHGLFAADDFRHAFLDRLKSRQSSGLAYEQQVETTLDALADHMETHLDVDGLLALAGLTTTQRPQAGKRSTA